MRTHPPLGERRPTDLDNLITFCGFHHCKVHNEGWGIAGDPNGRIEWIHPRGMKHEPARRLTPANVSDLDPLAEIEGAHRRPIARMA